MDVLLILSRHAGEVVQRGELLSAAWPGRTVSEDALSRCIYQLRRHFVAAGGSETCRSLLETIPKRGYRLRCAAALVDSLPREEPDFGLDEPGHPRVGISRFRRRLGWTALVAGIALAATGWWLTERGGTDAAATNSRLAMDAYIRATEYFQRADRQTALSYAVDLYQQALELDPAFTDAWAGLAQAHTDLYWHGFDRTPARLAQAEWALDRLFALDPDSPSAHLARAHYLLKGLQDFDHALRELEITERSIPEDPELHFLRAMAQRRLGNWALSITALDAALELDTRNISYLRQQSINYLFTRRFEDAQRSLDRILVLFPDDGTTFVDKVVLDLCRSGETSLARQYAETEPSPHYDEGLAYTYTNWLAAIFDRDYGRALEILDHSGEDPIFDGDLRNASFGPRTLYYARTHRLAGREREALEEYAAIARMTEQAAPSDSGRDGYAAAGRFLALAEAHAALGNRETALTLVRKADRLMPDANDAIMSSALHLATVTRVLVPVGDYTAAIDALDRYLAREGHWSVDGLRKDPRLEPLLQEPGFQELVSKYGHSGS